MKIAVAGKGGSGKTTISGTLARALARAGHSVVALDCDTNPMLGISLGVGPEETDRLVAARQNLETGDTEHQTSIAGIVDMFGSRVCVGIDARDGQVMTRGWEKRETITAVELAQRVAALGVERIVYTDVARDGMLAGVNLEQTCTIARESGLRVTASGGVASLADISRLRRVSESGVDSVIVGKALYEGRFSLKEAINEGII